MLKLVLGLLLLCCVASARKQQCAGCPVERPATANDVRDVNTLIVKSGSNNLVKKIYKVTTQVVEGFITTVKYQNTMNRNCIAEWYEIPWADPQLQSYKITCK